MISPYLNRPLLPIAVELPRMLEKIENQLAGKSAGRPIIGTFESAPS
jgi:hypothetical protein